MKRRGQALLFLRKAAQDESLLDAVLESDSVSYEVNGFHIAGAPLDNNIVERALKRVVLHRKNVLFHRTLNGAEVGDPFSSRTTTASCAAPTRSTT